MSANVESPDYTDRNLREVFMSIQLSDFPNGGPAVQAKVTLGLTAAANPDQTGPSVTLSFGIGHQPEATAAEIEQVVVEVAAALLSRLAKEDLAAIQTCLAETKAR